jgi:hypothetical protein
MYDIIRVTRRKKVNAYICTDDFDSVVTSNIRRLQHEQLSDEDIETIMAETFEGRKAWICSKLPPVRTIFVKFPPLKDVLSSHVIIYYFVDDVFLHLEVKEKDRCFRLPDRP